MTEIMVKIDMIERRGSGAFLKLECGHQRWVGGYPTGERRTFHRCLDCEMRAWFHENQGAAT